MTPNNFVESSDGEIVPKIVYFTTEHTSLLQFDYVQLNNLQIKFTFKTILYFANDFFFG